MERKTLIPRKVINTEGNLYYDERNRAFGIVRLKSDLVNEFPQLKEKQSKFSYKIVYYRNIEEFEKVIKELKNKKSENLPVLMWFFKEEKE
jgi:hypothetical protein